MKRIFTTSFVVLLGLGITVVLSGDLEARSKKAKTSAKSEVSKKESPKPVVAYTFTAPEEMKEFNLLIQRKRAVMTRMAVLREYLTLENQQLEQLNGQLLLKFNINPDKNYLLDPKTNQLVLEAPKVAAKK